MDLSQLKNTNDDQFKNDISFNAVMPDETDEGYETDVILTVRSVKNPAVTSQIAKLLNASQKEAKKLERPNLSDEQYKSVADAITKTETDIANLMLVKFSGLTDGDKPYPCNKETMKGLVEDHSWIRKNIVNKATSEHAFYKV